MMRWNNTKTYTEDDMIRMQQDAVKRVHEMQERAQQMGLYGYDPEPTIGEYHGPVIEAESRVVEQPPDPHDHNAQQEHHPQEHEHPHQQQVNNLPMNAGNPNMGNMQPHGGLLSNFNLDSESLLILGLIYLLYSEKADYPLLLALGYLLL